MAPQKRHDLLPQPGGRARAIGWAVVGEEGVAGTLIDVDLDLLTAATDRRSAGPLEQLRADLGGGVLVLGADRRQQRAAELLGPLQWRHRPRGGGVLLGRGPVDEAAPAV